MNHNVIWYRNDLRTLDHSGVYQATKNKQPTFAVFYICTQQWQAHDLSNHKIQYIYDRLNGLKQELALLNIPLFIFKVNDYQDSAIHLCKVIKKHHVNHVFLNNDYELDEKNRDKTFMTLTDNTCQVHQYDDNVFCHPHLVKTGQDTPFKVFTAFKNKITPLIMSLPGCLAKPKALPSQPSVYFKNDVTISKLSQHALFEKDSIKQLRQFCQNQSIDYLTQRDIPSVSGTSHLSASLSIGIISVKQAYFRLQASHPKHISNHDSGVNTWLNELIWREFYRHTSFHFDYICKHQSLKPNYESIKFSKDEGLFKQWSNGTTGYPIVDAAMRQLNQTGWMHNRLRMITASFLIKDLQIDWRMGERYFMQNLVDGDFSSNNGGWQWCASTGFDSAPYFRIFNPTTQSKRFDAKGDFIRKWIPELKDVPDKYIHAPHTYKNLKQLNIDYPTPIVAHKHARLITLALYKAAIG